MYHWKIKEYFSCIHGNPPPPPLPYPDLPLKNLITRDIKKYGKCWLYVFFWLITQKKDKSREALNRLLVKCEINNVELEIFFSIRVLYLGD